MSLSTTADHPIAICSDHIAKVPTMLIVKQHYRGHSQGDFTCFRSDSSVLFEVVGKDGSSGRRRQFIESSNGVILFELRRRYFNIKENWYLEFPADSGANDMSLSVAMKWKGWANFDITFTNIAGSNELTVLEVRARTARHVTYDVFFEGKMIAEARKIPGREAPGETARIRNNPAWEVDVSPGVDLSMVSMIAVILTDLNPANLWSRSGHA